jgi:hypothetical protein
MEYSHFHPLGRGARSASDAARASHAGASAMKPLPPMTDIEEKTLVRLSQALRAILRRWKKEAGVTRGQGLCACIVLAGTEGGLEGAMTREEFVAYVGELTGWAYDLGEQTRRERAQ